MKDNEPIENPFARAEQFTRKSLQKLFFVDPLPSDVKSGSACQIGKNRKNRSPVSF
jgi:hypothetical protein